MTQHWVDRLARLVRRVFYQAPPAPAPADGNAPPTIEQLTQELQRARKEALCRQHIGSVIARYFIMNQRTPDVAIPFEEVTNDSNPDWMPGVLSKAELSEPEFAVYGFFQDPKATILDIGAHFGYSAASIWTAGSPAMVVSFEPNAWHKACLQRVKDLRPGRYDFVSSGLGEARRALRFVIPVIEGVGVSGLSSAAIGTELDWAIPENVLRYMMDLLPDVPAPRLQFTTTDWQIAPLDELLRDTPLTVPLDRIVAIKIDVEGYEPSVIQGAKATLMQHKPFLMIEGANRVPDVVGQLRELGYRFGDLHSGAVRLTNEMSTRVSGFYLHESRLSEYRSLGLLLT